MSQLDEPMIAEVAGEEVGAGPQGSTRKRSLTSRLGLHKYSGLYVFVIIVIIFSLWDPSVFPTGATARIVANAQAITLMLAFAAIVPLVTGVFDLSIAQMLGFSGILCALLQRSGLNAILAVILTLLVAVVVGLANSFVIVKLKVNAFIGTLAMTSILAAMSIWIAGNEDVTTGISSHFTKVGQWTIPKLGIGSPFLLMIAVAVILWYVLERMPAGRRQYAAGDNAEAARLAGIPVNRLIVAAFLSSAVLASVGGIAYVAQVGVAQQSAGPTYLLPAFSAVFLGATQIVPGRFNVRGTIVGVLVLAAGIKGFELTVTVPWIDDMFTGLALIIAVALAQRDRIGKQA